MRRAGVSTAPPLAVPVLPPPLSSTSASPANAVTTTNSSPRITSRNRSILPSFIEEIERRGGAGGVGGGEAGDGDAEDLKKRSRHHHLCGYCRALRYHYLLSPFWQPSPHRSPSSPPPTQPRTRSTRTGFPVHRPPAASTLLVVVIALFLLFVTSFSWSPWAATTRRKRLSPSLPVVSGRVASGDLLYASRVAMSSSISNRSLTRTTSTGFVLLPQAMIDDNVADDKPNYGGVRLRMLLEENGHGKKEAAARQIFHDRRLDEGKRDRARPTDDTNDYYYNLDDDDLRNTYRGWHDDSIHRRKRCRRTRWHRNVPVNCNTFHELDVRGVAHHGGLRHVGAGSYKHVFIVDTAEGTSRVRVQAEILVWKNFGVAPKYDTKNYERMRKDALVAERVGPHPLIVDIYGYCGLAQLDQAMPDGGLESVALPDGFEYGVTLRDENELDPRNSLLPSEKLSLALDMFEAVALLHNYREGVIVHDDIQLLQFLLTPDRKHVKLNDFNRMEVMLWNDQDQEYCRYRNGPGQGEWRSPEEYKDLPLNEKIDIFSLGNNVFSILTGLVPFYGARGPRAAKKNVLDGVAPYVDPRWSSRSFAERKLSELIHLCQAYDPDDRIDAGAAVQFLRDAVRENDLYHKHEDGQVRANRRVQDTSPG